ncbi:uncharacterized protein Tco025E_04046 [Trypanosoma conorhini]|uniref:Uncharacterized protein n=1 Tax=Trypanosoma conorhini TaxID=83891 RepID=A0A3R7L290_9TRYP|nr:uncharacterized protein Tco025E_04046 [Trypanosoma conorhini]RNF19634.1 hypothetical protein Tco025E_04046 [Trypanosoma conorhini]
MATTGPATAGECAPPAQCAAASQPTGRRSLSPVGGELRLPAVDQKSASEGWGRGGRLRHNKTRPSAFQQGESALLFVEDGTGDKRSVTMRGGDDRPGDAKKRNFSKKPSERRAREPATTFTLPLTLGPRSGASSAAMGAQTSLSDTPKVGTASPGGDAAAPGAGGSRGGGQQRGRRVKGVVEYDPKTYSELLPATLRMRKVGDVEAGVGPGVAVSEMLAERDARHANRGVLAMNGKITQPVPLLELQEFVGTMKQLQERGRHMRRRWRRYLPCVTAVSGGAVRMLSEEEDTSSESLQDHDSDADFNVTLSRRQQQKSELTRAAISSWREEMNALRLRGDNARGAVLLRNELKRSRLEVEKARQGATLASLQMIHSEPTAHDLTEEEPRRSSAEDISWRTENEISQRAAAVPAPDSFAAGSVAHTKDRSGTHSDGKKSAESGAVGARTSAQLDALLHRGKGTTVYGLDPIRRRGSFQTHSLYPRARSPLSSLPHVSGFSSAMNTSAPWALDAKQKLERQAPHTRHDTQRRWRPLPVEYGVGEQSSLRFKAKVMQGRLEDCRSDIQNGEDIRRTRELLLELRPTRATLLADSLKHSQENARVILKQHRRCIFEKVAEKDSEERKEACLAYVDLLEQVYSCEVAENSLAAVTGVLQRVRDIISVSLTRCNARSYNGLLKDYFLIEQFTEVPVRDLLWRLAELFDMTRSQYKAALWNAYQALNTPRDYQARFREIDRTVLGIPTPMERRIRLTLHRCRFLQAHASVGTTHVLPATGGERARDLGEVSVQIKSEHQVLLSTAVRARVCGDEETFSWNVSRRDDKSLPLCGANLMDQVFRLHLCENTDLRVALLHNGLVVANGKFCLSDCTFNPRGLALLWLRLSGEEGVEAEVKLTLALLGDKHAHRKSRRK